MKKDFGRTKPYISIDEIGHIGRGDEENRLLEEKLESYYERPVLITGRGKTTKVHIGPSLLKN